MYREFVSSECAAALFGGLEAICLRWVSHPADVRTSELKMRQLEVAVGAGVPIPRTVVTNRMRKDPLFGDGMVVAKPVRYGLLGATPRPLVAFARAVAQTDLADLDGSPVILQERIDAAFHLRVIVVGDDVFVASLPAGPTVDWREDVNNHVRFEVRTLPDPSSLERGAMAMQRGLRLRFSAQDWIFTRDEKYVFLEANPSGQWLFIDDLFGGGITQAIARQLVALRDVDE
jgi:glutathione synthase/RimK-type ligase-like ATP-grasp enzyme